MVTLCPSETGASTSPRSMSHALTNTGTTSVPMPSWSLRWLLCMSQCTVRFKLNVHSIGPTRISLCHMEHLDVYHVWQVHPQKIYWTVIMCSTQSLCNHWLVGRSSGITSTWIPLQWYLEAYNRKPLSRLITLQTESNPNIPSSIMEDLQLLGSTVAAHSGLAGGNKRPGIDIWVGTMHWGTPSHTLQSLI